jgi:hypothetical protein
MRAKDSLAATKGALGAACKGRVPGLVEFLTALTLSANTVGAWDFAYSYPTVNAANADTYLVEQQHAKKVKDWTGGCYWGPDANDVPATLTYKFSFAAPTSEVFLHARLQSYNYAGAQGFRTDYGFTSLWASTDGTSWRLLLDGPAPGAVSVSDLTYHQSIPASLLGGTNLWVQARMQQHDALLHFADPAATWTDAQFSRSTPADTNEVFQLKASYGATPQTSAAAPGARLAWRTGLIAVLALVCLGLLCLALVCLGLLCVLVRRSGRQMAANAEVIRRLDEVVRRLGAGQEGLAQPEPKPRD